ncbi:MAG: response regulator [Leptospiraceae bacterium]|nr:response regulator [Leptospiraceae bacterium]
MEQIYSQTILLVEDDPVYATILSTIIERYFNYPTIIADGRNALEYLLRAEDIPKMILMDYQLPQINGIEILKTLSETNRNYPVIFLASAGETGVVVEAMKAGALDFLEKSHFQINELPFIINKNIHIFQDRIEKLRLQKELEEYKIHLEEIVKERTEELQIHKELLEDLVKLRTLELENALLKLKNAQNQVIQSEKMASLGILLAGVAHEINNPVNYINSSVIGLHNVFEDILIYLKKTTEIENLPDIPALDLEKSAERIEKMLTNIETGISKTKQIVNSLRIFSRSSEGSMHQTDIHENIDCALTILQNEYKGKVEIIKNYNEISLVHCFSDKLNQVLVNLFMNAIQAIENKGEIIITTLKHGKEKVSISIQDTGCGIPESIQNKIFDPFFTTKELGKGTGLGLSIVYDIIQQMQGEILMRSELGIGTIFTIILPISENTNG